MKKILNITLAAAFACAMTGCQDFLDTSSPSVVDRDFVFSNEESARGALYYGYETLRANRSVHNVGFFWHPVWGSDIEDSQDIYDEGSAGICEKWYYPGGTGNYNINSGEGTEVFTKLYETISVANSLISSFEALDNFQSIMTGEPNNLSDIYGQAVALRATCYWELCRWYGDVPHALNAGEQAKGLTSRYAIYDYHIRKLREVEPHMYRPGEGSTRADVMNRTYVQGLIGRLCMYNGGYATRRTDLGADFYVDGDGKVLTFDDWSVEKNGAIYGRRSDWKDLYAIAKEYLQAIYMNPGSVVLRTTDPRSTGKNGQEYNNPYQYMFQQMHAADNITLADESIYDHMNNPRRWHKWDTNIYKLPSGQQLPKDLDWDTWLGVTPYHEYNKDYHLGQWRCWYDFGMGALGDWGAHILDTAHEFLELGLPYEVTMQYANGHNDYFFPYSSTILFRFPQRKGMPPVDITWYDGLDNLPPIPAGYGVSGLDPNIPVTNQGDTPKSKLNPGKIIYTKDLIFKGGSHGSTLSIIPEEKAKEMADKLPEVPKSPSNHFENFLLACQGIEKTRSPFEINGVLSQVFSLGVMAQRLNTQLFFDPRTKQITNNEFANAMLAGLPPRKGWDEFYKL